MLWQATPVWCSGGQLSSGCASGPAKLPPPSSPPPHGPAPPPERQVIRPHPQKQGAMPTSAWAWERLTRVNGSPACPWRIDGIVGSDLTGQGARMPTQSRGHGTLLVYRPRCHFLWLANRHLLCWLSHQLRHSLAL